MNNPVPDYRLKIERAKRHIKDLESAIAAFHAENPYRVVVEDDTKTGQRLWKVRIDKIMPTELSSIVGDAIHNARAALDLLMVAVVRHCDPKRTSYNHVHFVIGDSKQRFESRLKENTKGAGPAAMKVIQDMKPYKGGDEAFFRLHQLDIIDKHKAIIPVWTAFSLGIFIDHAKIFPGFFEAGEAPKPIGIFVRSKGSPPLYDGSVLFRAPISLDRKFTDDHKFAFNVSFGEGQIVEGEPVVPALTQIIEFVEGVALKIEDRILSKPPA